VELLDATAAKPPVEKPQILDLYVRPPGKVGQVVYAPATFQFEATADNAQHYVWSFGDGEIQLADYQTTHTFDRPGTYNVKLLAFNGKEKVQQETSIEVQAPPAGALSVSMSVADQGTMVETRRREVVVSQGVQVNGKKGPSTVEQTISATAGFEIVGVELKHSQNQNVSKTDCKVAADRKSAKVVGQLVASAAVSQAVLNERYTVVEQRKSRASRDPIPVVSSVPPGGNAVVRLPQLPDDWTDVKREVAFELRQDERVLWRGPTLPQNVPVVVGGRTYNLAAALAGDKVQVSLASVR
jgi:PKD repeat protein